MARKPQENPQLDMTPMIDVVFELIIFFVVTIKQEDLFSKLNCNRPAPATGPASEKDDITVNIEIGRRYDGSPQGVILYNKREVKRTELDAALREIAKFAFRANEQNENIGARRLHTVMENLLNDISFNANGQHPLIDVVIDGEYVDSHLDSEWTEDNIHKYIL